MPLTDIKGLFREEAAFFLALTLFGNYNRVTRERVTSKTRESVESGIYLIISRHAKMPRAANQNNPLGGDKISDSKQFLSKFKGNMKR